MSIDLKKIIIRNGKEIEFNPEILSVGEPVFLSDIGVLKIKKFDGSFAELKELSTDSVKTEHIKDKSITTTKIQDFAVTNEKIYPGAVDYFKIADDAIDTNKIRNLAVTGEKIASDSISTPKILNGAVITDKIADRTITSGKLCGNSITNYEVADEFKVEDGVGELSITSHHPDLLKSADFCYHKKGKFVTIFCHIKFNYTSSVETNIYLSGLPYSVSAASINSVCAETSGQHIVSAEISGGNSIAIKNNIVSGQIFKQDETLNFSLSYLIR